MKLARTLLAFALTTVAATVLTAASVVAVAPDEARSTPAGMVLIPAGDYAPFFRGPNDPATIRVAAFCLDVRPVTNAEFLAFVTANPKWRRSHTSTLFADTGYLADWAGDLELGPNAPEAAPVVRVSWFAARSYAAWIGKRLPTTSEWERAASAGYTTVNGSTESAYRSAVFGWYAKPTSWPLPNAGETAANFFGVRDLCVLVWEWVSDFNSALVTGESRGDTGLERDLFCGAGATGARDLTNYPAFMRAGFRSSLRASYVVPNLGFRCAKSL
jgi:formylglycine-generating enzyme required for sulfatase activity